MRDTRPSRNERCTQRSRLPRDEEAKAKIEWIGRHTVVKQANKYVGDGAVRRSREVPLTWHVVLNFYRFVLEGANHWRVTCSRRDLYVTS